MPFVWMNNGVLCPLQNSGRSTPFHFCIVSNEGGGRRDSDMILTTRQFKRNYREC